MVEERLQKILARAGIASRRAAEDLIAAGRVSVNGKVVTELGTRADAGSDEIRVDEQSLGLEEPEVHYVLYKPERVVTTLSDPEGRRSVGDLLGRIEERVYPVGRLDYDAEGVLLLTNDGDLAHKLTHPRWGVRRTYLAKVKGEPGEDALARLVEGVRLDDGRAKAVEATFEQRTPKNTWIRIVVTEGRHHLVKRMCEAIGHPVVRLFRSDHAGINVEGMKPGQVRPLNADEVKALRRAVSREAPLPAGGLPRRRRGTAVRNPILGSRERTSAGSRPPRSFERGGPSAPRAERGPPGESWKGPPGASARSAGRGERRPWEKGAERGPGRTGGSRPERAGASRPERAGASRPERTGASRPERTGASRPERTGASRPERTGASRPERTGASRLERTGASRPERTGGARPGSRSRGGEDRRPKREGAGTAPHGEGRWQRQGPGSFRPAEGRSERREGARTSTGAEGRTSLRPEGGRSERASPRGPGGQRPGTGPGGGKKKPESRGPVAFDKVAKRGGQGKDRPWYRASTAAPDKGGPGSGGKGRGPGGRRPK